MAAKDKRDTQETAEFADIDTTVEKKPKKEKKPKPEKKRKVKSGGLGATAFIIIFAVVIIGALAWIIGYNPYGIRDKYLSQTLSNIPIVKNLIPPPEAADAGEEPEKTADELNAEITRYIRQLDAAQALIAEQERDLKLRQDEINRLKPFEDQQTQFKADKEAFDTAVALSDPAAYAAYYEKISPENAENLYPRAKGDAEREQEVNNYLSAINKQDESSAAKMLEQLMPADLDLVVSILKGLSDTKAGDILTEMSAENAASVAKRWDPITGY